MRTARCGLTRAVITIGSVSALALALFVQTAGAGGQPALDAPLTVLKTVSGPVPAGTTFTAQIQCDDAIIHTGEDSVDSATVTFDDTGQPTSPDTFGFDDPGSCTVTETAAGGATTTSYACEGSVPDDSSAESSFGGVSASQVEAEPICAAAGPQATPVTVNINTPDQEATVTIANSFVAAQPEAQPATAVAAAPAFTG
jgi:hypothetical protein